MRQASIHRQKLKRLKNIMHKLLASACIFGGLIPANEGLARQSEAMLEVFVKLRSIFMWNCLGNTISCINIRGGLYLFTPKSL